MSMETSYSNRSESTESRGGTPATVSLDPLRPLIAGARARGIADGLELAGVAAILVDGSGMVLHAGPAARRKFGADVSLRYDHLIGHDGDSTSRIQDFIAAALSHGVGQGPGPADLEITSRDGRRLVLRARPVPGAGADTMQLLKLLIILEDQAVS